jgi:subtilisin family serine protease
MRPAHARPQAVDVGDYYNSVRGIRHLDRIAGALAVTVEAQRDAADVGAQLTAPRGVLDGYTAAYFPAPQTIVLYAPEDAQARQKADPSLLADAVSRARTGPGVRYANPVFRDWASGLRLILTDEIILRLASGVDAKKYFGSQWSSVRPIAQSGPEYIVPLTNAAAEYILSEVNRRAEQDEVVWAQPNMRSEIIAGFGPNDTEYTNQWFLDHYGQNGTKTNEDIRAAQAWDVTQGGSPDIVIAIIDSGVDMEHPDLSANIFTNTAEWPPNGADDDGNGYVDDYRGWDFADGDNDPSPIATNDNHGTPCAGLAAGVAHNNLGGAGVAFQSRILAVKLWRGDFWPASADRADAIRYAAGINGAGATVWRGADVLSMSWVMGFAAVVDSALDDAAANGRNGRGCPLFAASGNNGSGYNSYYRPTSGFPAGNYYIQFEYYKDPADTGGDDRVWLAKITLPNAEQTVQRFDEPGVPAGWQVGGDTAFSIAQDPEHAFGAGRYVARSGAIGDGQVSWIRTPTFTLAPGSNLYFKAWVSTEEQTTAWDYPPNNDDGDWLFVRFFNVGTATWSNYAYEAGQPGNHEAASSDVVGTNVNFPANNTNVIAVGGSTDYGYRTDYSQWRGTGVDFVAPTAGGHLGVLGTDRTGTNGYNEAAGADGNYTYFSGTSASTPIAAGVGALLLSVSNNLSPQEVRTIMQDSCDKIGYVAYDDGTNQYMGHGRINAWRALCSNGIPVDLVISNDVVRNRRSYIARNSIIARQGFVINGSSPTGDVTFRSGNIIRLQPDASVERGARYTTDIDPSLQ